MGSEKKMSTVKSKFHCKSCDIGFLSKKNYEKHRKTQEHKDTEKRYKVMQVEKLEKAKLEEIQRKQIEQLNYALKHDPTG